jgi:hypothetical protein
LLEAFSQGLITLRVAFPRQPAAGQPQVGSRESIVCIIFFFFLVKKETKRQEKTMLQPARPTLARCFFDQPALSEPFL